MILVMTSFNRDYYERRFTDKLIREKAHILDIKFLQKNVKMFTGMHVLDFGCEDGSFLQNLEKFVKINAKGIEINEHSRKIAILNKISLIDKIEDSNNKFDLIILRGVLHHLPNPFEIINRCIKQLDDNGSIVFLQNPNSNSFLFKKFRKLPIIEEVSELSEVYWVSSPNQLTFYMERNEFKCIWDTPYLFTPYPKLLDPYYYLKSRLLGRYSPFAWPGNIYRLAAIRNNGSINISTNVQL